MKLEVRVFLADDLRAATFGEPTTLHTIRPVHIVVNDETLLADDEDLKNVILNEVFHYGQNDFQPSPFHRSVSVGDVIELKPAFEYWRVESIGFKKLSKEQSVKVLNGAPLTFPKKSFSVEA